MDLKGIDGILKGLCPESRAIDWGLFEMRDDRF